MFRTFAFACSLLALPVAVQAKIVPVPAPDAPIEEARKYFTEDPDAPMIAPKGYDVTIVEYVDYQCPACRTTHGPLMELAAKDKKVRIIFRDWPIFGAQSEKSARLALASKYQGKYVEFHAALMNTERPLTDEKIKAAAVKAGVDWDRLQKDKARYSQDIEDLIARNEMQADILGLDGTPGFIIGDTQSFGGMTLKELEQSVAEARNPAASKATEGAKR